MTRKKAIEPPQAPVSPTRLWSAALPDSAGCMAFSPSAESILGVATLAGPVLFFSAGGELVHREPGHAGGALCIAYSPSGHRVATGGQDGQIQLYDPNNTATPPLCFSAGTAPVLHLCFSSDGQILASASGRSLCFWSDSGEKLGEIQEHASTVMSLCYCEPRSSWFSACYGGIFELGRNSLAIERHLSFKTSILRAEPSPCGRWVAAGTQDPLVRVWDLERDWDIIHLEGYPGKTPIVRFSEDTQILATASASQAVLWSFAFGDPKNAPHAALSGHTRRISAMEFIQRGHILITASLDGQLRLYDLRIPGVLPFTTLPLGPPLHLLSVDASETCAALAGTDGSLHAVHIG